MWYIGGMSKSPKAFRLSKQAIEALRWLVSETGANETAIVEMALVRFRKTFEKSEHSVKDLGQIDQSSLIAGKKKRKRH